MASIGTHRPCSRRIGPPTNDCGIPIARIPQPHFDRLVNQAAAEPFGLQLRRRIGRRFRPRAASDADDGHGGDGDTQAHARFTGRAAAVSGQTAG